MLELIRSSCAALVLVSLLLSTSNAQEGAGPERAAGSPRAEDAPAEDAAAEDAAIAGDGFDADAERRVFREAVEAWGESISETRAVLIRFHNGTAETEPHYRDQYRELQVRGRETFDRAVRAATALLEHDPQESFLQAQFLLVAVHYRYNRDWFELTGPAAEVLMAVGTNDPKLPEIAGVSFFATDQFDRASPHLAKAAETGTLDEKHAGLPQAVEEYRKHWDRERVFRAEDREKDDLPQVRFSTTRGDVLVELFEDQAPNTVANFINLVESGYYDQLPFYQVIDSQIAMVGDAADDGLDASAGRIPDENQRSDARVTFRGSLAMAKLPNPQSQQPRTIPHSARSHFFFTLMPFPEANSEYTVFGRVIQGMDAVSALRRVDPSVKDPENPAAPPDRVLSAEVIRKRSHPYEPEFIGPSPTREVRGRVGAQSSKD